MDQLLDYVQQARIFLTGPSFADSRTAEWPLIDWQLPAAIGMAYLLGIPLGIWIMRDRPAMKVRRAATLHNAILFSLSLYMAVETLRQASSNFEWPSSGFKLACNPNDPQSPDGGDTFSVNGAALARILYIHYISKAYEFVDTLIMILKKNTRQVSFLHVYHHATTFFPVWWAVMKYGPGGDAWFCCFLNSSIHVIMYGYYLLATLGFRMGAFKPIITLSQMIQFLGFMYQGSTMLWRDCYRPRVSPVLLTVQCAVFFTLFADFFVRTYVFKKSSSKLDTKKA